MPTFCRLPVFFSAIGSGVSIPMKDRGELRGAHRSDELFVGGEIQARFGVERERVARLLLPARELDQDGADRLLVSDEVVVDEEDLPAMPQLAQRLELGEDLRGLLHPWHPSEDLDDVAELAGERTAA